MKILVVSQYFYPENFRINDLCVELVRRGHEVTVLTAYPQYPEGKIYCGYGFNIKYETQWNGVNIVRVKTFPRGKTLFGLFLNAASYAINGIRWAKHCKYEYDILYSFGVSPLTSVFPAVAYKRKHSKPLVLNLQDLWPESIRDVLNIRIAILLRLIEKMLKRIYSSCDKILCSSKGFSRLLSNKGVPSEKLMFWPQFATDIDKKHLKCPAQYDAKNFNVVFTGNIGDSQGLDLLITTASYFKDSNVKFFLVGDGRAKQRLKRMVADLGLLDTVYFVNRVSELEAKRFVYYADCAFLSFKDNELFSNIIPAKLQTYLSCGTVVLAAAKGESAQIICEANCGFAVDQNPSELSTALCRLKETTEEQRIKMGDNGRRYFERYFTIDNLVDQLESLLGDLQQNLI